MEKTMNRKFDNSSLLSRECPFLMMTNAYHSAGMGKAFLEDCKKTLSTPILAEAEFVYFQGDIDKTYELIKNLKVAPLNFYERIDMGMLLALCAMYYANNSMWEEGRSIILDCPYKNEKEAQQIPFWIAVSDSSLYDDRNFPNWFQQGNFDLLPIDSFPFTRYCYAKYLLLASDYALPNYKGNIQEFFISMKALAAVCEPLISHAEKAILAEIYLRLICAIAYHNFGKDAQAAMHIEKAFALASPDQLYRPFSDTRQPLDLLIDQVIGQIDKTALVKIKKCNKSLLNGWVKLHNLKLNRMKSNELTIREREVSRLAACGLSNAEISERLHITINTVKQTVKHAMEKTNCNKRSDLIKYI